MERTDLRQTIDKFNEVLRNFNEVERETKEKCVAFLKDLCNQNEDRMFVLKEHGIFEASIYEDNELFNVDAIFIDVEDGDEHLVFGTDGEIDFYDYAISYRSIIEITDTILKEIK
ncbi:MAG: hypothetical protein J5725_13295 [Bacteroidales bacterium]|nr:hypothetical protein [Bacteroidales bacterium]